MESTCTISWLGGGVDQRDSQVASGKTPTILAVSLAPTVAPIGAAHWDPILPLSMTSRARRLS